MRCYAYNCKDNDDGFCKIPDYVVINEDGKCDSICEIVNKEGAEQALKESEQG